MKLATLTALSWSGDLPRFGDFIMAQRGRTAFRVVEIRMPMKPGAQYVARFGCERVARVGLPADAIVHGWEWGKRG
ncbi:hypothetical protein [Bosea sp. FBZP-16]|uniref:hypothetical protein n=1 Tax=Bosea sp. FBZP-16 TaxID=2065382 RepID=UPI000C30CDAC|nr:hypothetical protein [Bosea sp. FBZP-16]